MNLRVTPFLILALSAALYAQTPAFEVASVKSIPSAADGSIHIHMNSDSHMINYSGAGLKDVIAEAYRIQKDQITGPSWLDSELYSITARIPSGATAQQIPEMLQALLRDRFGLVFHREPKDMAVFALVVAKSGLKLKSVDAETGCHGTSDAKGTIFLNCQSSLAQFADSLTRQARQTGLDRPVVDKTQLPGFFGIDLQWNRDAAGDAGGAALVEALTRELGLRLEAQKISGEILVVDSANRIPSEN